ncbi:hypothetical protein CB1_000293004 [Camelus ferus]|nr:hypothetical protein CB1_000293004 [Camelus ferus]
MLNLFLPATSFLDMQRWRSFLTRTECKEGQRRKRTKFDKNQYKILTEAFENDRYPDINDRVDLANRTKIPEPRIQDPFRAPESAPQLKDLFWVLESAPQFQDPFRAPKSAPQLKDLFWVLESAPQFQDPFRAPKSAPQLKDLFWVLESVPQFQDPFRVLESAPQFQDPFRALESAPQFLDPFRVLESAPQFLDLFRMLESVPQFQDPVKLDSVPLTALASRVLEMPASSGSRRTLLVQLFSWDIGASWVCIWPRLTQRLQLMHWVSLLEISTTLTFPASAPKSLLLPNSPSHSWKLTVQGLISGTLDHS